MIGKVFETKTYWMQYNHLRKIMYSVKNQM
jgi:hypothetical protein